MSNENSSGTRRFYGWTIVVSLWIIYFLNVGFPMYGGQTVNTFMADEMGFKRTILGLAFSLFNLFQGLPGPLIGYTIQKKGARFSIALGSILILVSAILMGYVVKSQWLFLLTFGVIAGVGVGFGTVVPVQTTVTQWFDRKRSRAMAITLTASGFGGFVAAPLLTKVLSGTGKWNNCWLVVAGAALPISDRFPTGAAMSQKAWQSPVKRPQSIYHTAPRMTGRSRRLLQIRDAG